MVDYDKLHALRIKDLEETGGSARDGLTVRDYFAAKAMGALLSDVDWRQDMESWEDAAFAAYKMADAMLKARVAKNTERCSVEEAFGLPQ